MIEGGILDPHVVPSGIELLDLFEDTKAIMGMRQTPN
jgi:hypothetical protein